MWQIKFILKFLFSNWNAPYPKLMWVPKVFPEKYVMNNRDLSAEEVYADDLTWREQEVLILLAERLTNREIAERLHLAESTVKDYVGKILSKLYVKNRREAVERAKALGLLDGDRKTVVSPPGQFACRTNPVRRAQGRISRNQAAAGGDTLAYAHRTWRYRQDAPGVEGSS